MTRTGSSANASGAGLARVQEPQTKRRIPRRAVNLVVRPVRDDPVVLGRRPADGALVRAERYEGADRERERIALDQAIAHGCRVLHVHELDALFQHDPAGSFAELEAPHGDAALEADLAERVLDGERRGLPVELVSTELDDAPIRKRQRLRELAQHQGATDRGGERRDEQSVEAPGRHARERAGRVSAAPVRDEPFAVEQVVDGRFPAHGDTAKREGHQDSFAVGSKTMAEPAASISSPCGPSGGAPEPP